MVRHRRSGINAVIAGRQTASENHVGCGIYPQKSMGRTGIKALTNHHARFSSGIGTDQTRDPGHDLAVPCQRLTYELESISRPLNIFSRAGYSEDLVGIARVARWGHGVQDRKSVV